MAVEEVLGGSDVGRRNLTQDSLWESNIDNQTSQQREGRKLWSLGQTTSDQRQPDRRVGAHVLTGSQSGKVT